MVFNKFFPFVEALAEKVHNLQADSLKIALSNTAPSSANALLADITQISYTNLSSRNLTVASSSQSGGVYKLVINDLTLTASGAVATYQYIVLYNDTPAGKNLIGWYQLPSAITLGNGDTHLLDFSAVNGALQIV